MHFRSQKKCAQDVSLYDTLETGADGAPLALMDVICEDTDITEQVAAKELGSHLRQAVIDHLTEQEKKVIQLRYGLTDQPPMRQREVAAALGISRSYISRIEKRALQKLRVVLEG